MDFSIDNWNTLTLAEQLGNVGSDFDRAMKWKAKAQPQLFMNAARRTLDQLDMTLTSSRLNGVRRKEIARVRESTCYELFSELGTAHSAKQLSRYFLSMASLARMNKS